MSRPYFSAAMYLSAAFSMAGFFITSSVFDASSMSRAPRRNSSMSNPKHTARDNPTSENTEKRPPTPSGTRKVSHLFSLASCLSRVGFLSLGSVTAVT